jgi:hypothetical protein
MEIKRKTEMFVETTRRFVIRRRTGREQIFCFDCGEPMLTSEQAAALLETSCRTVFRLVESGSMHFSETKTGSVLVCLSSLAAILHDATKRIDGVDFP